MQILVRIPSKQETLNFSVTKHESVSEFRQRLQKRLQIPTHSFILIALGKVLLDYCSDNRPAKLASTYRIRDKTCILVHIKPSESGTNVPENISGKRKRSNAKNHVRFADRVDDNETTDSANEGKIQKQQIGSSSLNCVFTRPVVVTPSSTDYSSAPLSPPSVITDNRVITMPFENAVCTVCNNDKEIKLCSECGCAKCLRKTGDPLICDQCDQYWHLKCAGLSEVPTADYWYCPDCYNRDSEYIIGKDTPISDSSKTFYRSFRISARDPECALVHRDHIGKIPGVYCGQTWASKRLAMDWGVHRSNARAVVGSVTTGALSLCLTYPVKEDRDVGYEFVFSGLYGQMARVGSNAKVTKSQPLTCFSKALALTCYAPFNDKVGATSPDWRKSRPIRVCRNWKWGKQHPQFAPFTGSRYDGLYKLVRYWPHKVESTGQVFWKFLFRRDDPEAPVWSIAGKSNISKRGLRMIYDEKGAIEKIVRYKIPVPILRLIDEDRMNTRLWNEIKTMDFYSEFEFLQYIFDTAVVCSSSACAKPIQSPVTTPCGHICCLKCLQQSSANECFECRGPIPPSKAVVNENLVAILKALNYAYTDERTEQNPYKVRRSTLPCFQYERDQEEALTANKPEIKAHYGNCEGATASKQTCNSKSSRKRLRAVVRIVLENDIADAIEEKSHGIQSIQLDTSSATAIESPCSNDKTTTPPSTHSQQYRTTATTSADYLIRYFDFIPQSPNNSIHINTRLDVKNTSTSASVCVDNDEHALNSSDLSILNAMSTQSSANKNRTETVGQLGTAAVTKATNALIPAAHSSCALDRALELSQQNDECSNLYPFKERIQTSDCSSSSACASSENSLSCSKEAVNDMGKVADCLNEYSAADN